jgi:hypothetical protein
MSVVDPIFGGYHNGYGFSWLMVSTSKGTMSVNFPDGGVYINRHTPETVRIRASDGAEKVWRDLFDTGSDSDNEFVLSLYDTEDDDRSRLAEITEITEAAGLGPPWVRDPDDGTLVGRWKPPISQVGV